MGIGVLLNVSFGNMYQVHDIVKRYVRGTLCVNMNETLIPKEFRVEGENGLGTDLGRCSCNQIITLGSELVTSPSVWAPFIGSSVSMVSEPLPSGSPSAR
jgi:hypothetical protein